MIKRAQDIVKKVKQQVRGGKGSMEIIRLVHPEETFTKHLQTLARVTLEPGSSIGLHPHDNTEEIYYILKGRALFLDNGTEKILEQGDATVTGGGETHSIEALGPEPLEFIGVVVG